MAILYIDMDGVVADLEKNVRLFAKIGKETYLTDDIFDKTCQQNPFIFEHLEPIVGAKESIKKLSERYEIYFLSTPMWDLPESFKGKRIWLDKHFGKLAHKRLILTHRKDLNKGDYLIDDRTANGVERFEGMHIHFGTKEFKNWEMIELYLMNCDNAIKA